MGRDGRLQSVAKLRRPLEGVPLETTKLMVELRPEVVEPRIQLLLLVRDVALGHLEPGLAHDRQDVLVHHHHAPLEIIQLGADALLDPGQVRLLLVELGLDLLESR